MDSVCRIFMRCALLSCWLATSCVEPTGGGGATQGSIEIQRRTTLVDSLLVGDVKSLCITKIGATGDTDYVDLLGFDERGYLSWSRGATWNKTYQYTFDQNGKILRITVYDSTHSTSETTEYEYNSTGNPVSQNGLVYTYADSAEWLLQTAEFPDNGWIETVTYDTRGVRRTLSRYLEDDACSIVWRYNDNGYQMSMESDCASYSVSAFTITRNSENRITQKRNQRNTMDYVYSNLDNAGNWQKMQCITTLTGSPTDTVDVELYERIFTYY